MRIRKRQVPLPFSSISPVPLSSDPNFNCPPTAVVQLPLRQQQLPSPPPPTTPFCFDPLHPSESDHPNHSIGQPLATQALDSSAFRGTTTHGGEQLMKTKQDYSVLKPGGDEEEKKKKKKNDSGKTSILGEELGTEFLSQSSSSQHQAVERWGEGEKPFPLKKRRGGVEVEGEGEGDLDDTIMAKNAYNKRAVKSNAGKMKTKLNKKLVEQRSNDGQVMNESNGVDPSGAKKRGRGGALMEGSRCSRVNGRGWRCCQQTLVGYSLCEHHLGKGRLRSITSVRSRAKEERQANNAADDHQAWILSNSSQPLGKQTKGESGDKGKPLMIAKKRVKLGMVKARSMSSLLGQDDNAIAEADDK
ncbi:hypothetical protein GQ457_06G010870 [Hibiscus cannabinus]